MSKKVLIISSSPRRGGNSDLLCDEFLKGAKEAGHDAEKIFLKDKKINYCEDCGTCYKNNKPCVQKDDMKEILDKMLEADVIVMATPVTKYLEIKNKDFYFIATAATEDEKEMVRTIDGFRGFLDCLEDVREKGVILAHSVWNKEEVKDKKYMQDAYNLGLNV